MCNSLLHLHNIRNIKGHTHEITIPSGSKVKVSQLGDVQITPQLILKKVLFVPKFRFDLVSVHELCRDNNIQVSFTNEHCMVQDLLMTRILPLGSLTGSLYTLGHNNEVSTNMVSNKTISTNIATPKSSLEEAKLWHIRMGHMPFFNMKYICPHLISLVFKRILFVPLALKLGKLGYLFTLVLLRLQNLLR